MSSLIRFIQLANISQANTKALALKYLIRHPLKDFISQVFFEDKIGTGVPGAGNYFPANDLSDSGKYVLSTNKGDGRRRLDK